MTPRIPPEAAAAAARGELIEAIKLTREATGLGLKESKDLVDRHVRGHAAGWDDDDEAAAPVARPKAPAHTPRPAAAPPRPPGLAPGEVPRSRGPVVAAVVLVVAVAIYLVVR